jgi:methionyl-tRNA synthetase
VNTTYVTVAIPYVNAEPHLGYAYELVAADIYARARRQSGDSVRLLGGTDDYSLKNVLAAEAAGRPTAEYVAEHADRFDALGAPLELSFDDFLRTSSDPRHRPAVERLWRACSARGDLYRKTYRGEYCVGCEQYYPPTELLTDGDGTRRCREHLTAVEQVAETNWFFRLSAYQEHVDRLIESGELEIHPRQYREEVLAFVRGGLDDISVSRSVTRARGWGIPVPDDDEQVVYVWFDALTNYLSALDFGDPDSVAYERWWRGADRRVHVVGKGIIRFHAVYWPAFLASAGQPAPTRIEVHPYLTVDGAKISKSSSAGRTRPDDVVDRFGADALRWWFARDVSATTDTDFTEQRLVARANDDLAHGVGNVTNRVVSLLHRFGRGRVTEPAALPVDGAIDVDVDVLARLHDFDLRAATRLIRDAIDALNADIEATRPWEIARLAAAGVAGARANLDHVLSRQIAGARAIALALAPIVPGLARRLTDQLTERDGSGLPAASPVFVRRELGGGRDGLLAERVDLKCT